MNTNLVSRKHSSILLIALMIPVCVIGCGAAADSASQGNRSDPAHQPSDASDPPGDSTPTLVYVNNGESASCADGQVVVVAAGGQLTADHDCTYFALTGSSVVAYGPSIGYALYNSHVSLGAGAKVVAQYRSNISADDGAVIWNAGGASITVSPGAHVTNNNNPGGSAPSQPPDPPNPSPSLLFVHVGESQSCSDGQVVVVESGANLTADAKCTFFALSGGVAIANGPSFGYALAGSHVTVEAGAELIAQSGSSVEAGNGAEIWKCNPYQSIHVLTGASPSIYKGC